MFLFTTKVQIRCHELGVQICCVVTVSVCFTSISESCTSILLSEHSSMSSDVKEPFTTLITFCHVIFIFSNFYFVESSCDKVNNVLLQWLSCRRSEVRFSVGAYVINQREKKNSYGKVSGFKRDNSSTSINFKHKCSIINYQNFLVIKFHRRGYKILLNRYIDFIISLIREM